MTIPIMRSEAKRKKQNFSLYYQKRKFIIMLKERPSYLHIFFIFFTENDIIEFLWQSSQRLCSQNCRKKSIRAMCPSVNKYYIIFS